MKWCIESSGPKSAEWNMQADDEKLKTLSPASLPVLRFYEWERPAATFGYFVNPWEYFDPRGVLTYNLQLAKRPTGGGIIFHLEDLAFSLIVPATHSFYKQNTLHIYQEINSHILEAIVKTAKSIEPNYFSLQSHHSNCNRGFCMAQATVYDILIEGRKVGGAAIRKTRQGLLYQGSICLSLPPFSFLEGVLLKGQPVIEAMQLTSYPLTIEKKVLMQELTNHLTAK